MKKVLSTGLFILLFSASVIPGRPLSASDRSAPWKPIGPGGGWITALAENPSAPDEVYAVAVHYDLGRYRSRLFRTIDGGRRWTEISIFGKRVYDIVVNPGVSDILYALQDEGLLISLDRGATWAERPFMMPYFELAQGVNRITLAPDDPSTLFVCGTVEGYGGWEMAILESRDRGRTWTVNKPDPEPGSFGWTYDLAISPSDPWIIYAGGVSWSSQTTDSLRIFKSSDGGRSWRDAKSNIYRTYNGVRALAVDPQDPQTVIAGTSRGLFRSTNGGKSWTDTLGMSMIIDTVSFSRKNPDVVFIGNGDRCPFLGCFRSNDGGRNWTEAVQGLHGSWITGIVIEDARVLLSTNEGVFKSLNTGALWRDTSAGINAGDCAALAIAQSDPRILYAGLSRHVLFRSINSGIDWKPRHDFAHEGEIHSIAVHPSDPAIIYVLSRREGLYPGYSGVFRSEDGGRSFSWILEGRDCNALVLSPVDPGHIYVGGYDSLGMTFCSALFRSLDGGKSWSKIRILPRIDSMAQAIAIHPKNEDIIYVGGIGHKVPVLFKTVDGGAHWSDIKGTIKSKVKSLAIDPLIPEIVYAGTMRGIFRSADGGRSWAQVLDGRGEIRRIEINPANPLEVFACGQTGVFRSIDRGTTWLDMSEGLVFKESAWLAMDPSRRILYAATRGAGICRIAF